MLLRYRYINIYVIYFKNVLSYIYINLSGYCVKNVFLYYKEKYKETNKQPKLITITGNRIFRLFFSSASSAPIKSTQGTPWAPIYVLY